MNAAITELNSDRKISDYKAMQFWNKRSSEGGEDNTTVVAQYQTRELHIPLISKLQKSTISDAATFKGLCKIYLSKNLTSPKFFDLIEKFWHRKLIIERL